jgi:hypothetical protein
MTKISFTRSPSSPTSPPLYDPRENVGISFYVDTTERIIWLGLSKTGDHKWGRFPDYHDRSTSSGAGTFTNNFPIVTTSSLAPETTPQYIPSDGRLHIHISYLVDNTFRMYIGTSKSPAIWSRYDVSATI